MKTARNTCTLSSTVRLFICIVSNTVGFICFQICRAPSSNKPFLFDVVNHHHASWLHPVLDCMCLSPRVICYTPQVPNAQIHRDKYAWLALSAGNTSRSRVTTSTCDPAAQRTIWIVTRILSLLHSVWSRMSYPA